MGVKRRTAATCRLRQREQRLFTELDGLQVGVFKVSNCIEHPCGVDEIHAAGPSLSRGSDIDDLPQQVNVMLVL